MRRPQKTCAICESGVRVVDFKDERTLSRFLTERGKILPSRLSGTCARHQRQLSTAIKRARQLALGLAEGLASTASATPGASDRMRPMSSFSAGIRRRRARGVTVAAGMGCCEAAMLEEGVSDHRHERMTVKAVPGSSLEVIETEFFFQLLVSLLANPTRLDGGR